jgi:hypothetical protein
MSVRFSTPTWSSADLSRTLSSQPSPAGSSADLEHASVDHLRPHGQGFTTPPGASRIPHHLVFIVRSSSASATRTLWVPLHCTTWRFHSHQTILRLFPHHATRRPPSRHTVLPSFPFPGRHSLQPWFLPCLSLQSRGAIRAEPQPIW